MPRILSEIEGPISSVGGAGDRVEIVAMGINVVFEAGLTADGEKKTIHTPTTELTTGQFRDTTPFPGRSEEGFVGGTIIAIGEFEQEGTQQVFHAEQITVEPAETVLVGALTKNDPGTPRQLEINGVPVVMLTDARLCSNPEDPSTPTYTNVFGFPIKVESAIPSFDTGPDPEPTSAEGYFASGTFHAFLVEYGGVGELLDDPATTPQIVIERAEYRDRGTTVEYKVRGYVTNSHVPPGSDFQRVEIRRRDADIEDQAIAEAEVQVQIDGFEFWSLDDEFVKPGGDRSGPPIKIVARNLDGANVEAEIEPDVRIDEDEEDD